MILSVEDEFRDGSLFGAIQEKFRQALAERGRDHEFGWGDTGSDGAQPRAEGAPHLVGGDGS